MRFPWWPWSRRERPTAPLPPELAAAVARNVPLAARLDPERRLDLEALTQRFLEDKSFEGCGGLELTDEIRVTIAAQACLLLVGLEVTEPYPGLDVVRVYPASYQAPTARPLGPAVSQRAEHRLGESSRRGYVVLSWRDARRGAADASDGRNVVLHEFAHQLDTQDGSADGAPVLADRSLYGPWAEVLGEAFERLVADVDAARPGALDAYGATNPAEFFAVATEAFFERGAALRRRHPELYDVLKRYYGQDPAG